MGIRQMDGFLSFKGLTIGFKDVSESLIKLISLLGWSAYIAHLLLEIMKIYQF
jgi:hypothetical protein